MSIERIAPEQNALDMAEAVAELFGVDLGGWSNRQKKMAGAQVLHFAALRLNTEKED